MSIVEDYYYTILSKFFLKILGIWPHDKSRLVLLQQVLIIISTVIFVLLQLAVFITTTYDMNLFVKIMSVTFAFIIIIVKYCCFILNSRNIANLHYQIQKDWKIMRNKIENEIIQKYARYCQYCTTLVFLLASFGIIIVSLLLFHPIILNIILPLDEPRSVKLLIKVEYFVLQDEYIYFKILYGGLMSLLCVSMILATSMQMLIFVFHSIGMFEITSHRIKYSMEDNILQNISNFKKEYAFCENLIHAVIAHRRAMKFSELCVSTFNITFCILALLGVLSLSINIFRFLNAISISKDLEDAVISSGAIIFYLLYMFIANYFGQIITDYNYEIFERVYDTPWYLISIPSRKLILFLMQKTGKEFNLRIGFIIVGKVESFAMLLNSALSYVAVMFSIH